MIWNTVKATAGYDMINKGMLTNTDGSYKAAA